MTCSRCGTPHGGDCCPRCHLRVDAPTHSTAAVTVARVLVALGAGSAILWAVVMAAISVASMSFLSAMQDEADADYTDSTPGGMTFTALAGLAIVLCGIIVVLAVLDLRLLPGLARGEARARRHLTGHVVVDFTLGLVLLAALFGPQSLSVLLVAIPGTALVLGLLWLPESSRRHFGDLAPPSPVALHRHAPPQAPAAPPQSGAQRPSGPLTPREVTTPWVEGRSHRPTPPATTSCARCGSSHASRDLFCGYCGAHLRSGAPSRC